MALLLRAMLGFIPLGLVACSGDQGNTMTLDLSPGTQEREFVTHPLVLPERKQRTYITDVATVLGKSLSLVDEDGGCKFQFGDKEPVWVKPMAPCYFMRSPGTDKPQVFQSKKTEWVVAFLGTPVGKRSRCGQEVNGIVISTKAYHVSDYILRGSVYCADNGLDNYQYSLFGRK